MSAPATFYVISGGGNDTYWRCEAPADVLEARVSRIAAGCKINEPNTDTGLPWSMVFTLEDGSTQRANTRRRYDILSKKHLRYVSAVTDFPGHEGVAVFTRPDIDRAALALTMQQQGIRTVAEADDLHMGAAHLNLFQRQQGANEITREAHCRSMAAVNVNVFSTAWLRDRYAKEYRQRFGKARTKALEMHVCRNHVPSSAWPERIEQDGPLRVGFMGSPSHVWDINLAYSAFHAAKQLGCETWMVGYNPGDINPDPNLPERMVMDDGTPIEPRTKESKEAEAKWARIVDRHIGWTKPDDFHRMALPFDIGVAPLWRNDFTMGKSDVKAMEYTISGAVSVLASNPAYTRAGWRHGVNCLVANSPDDYGHQTVRLIKDAPLRRELLAAAEELVRERNEHVMKQEWSDALGV